MCGYLAYFYKFKARKNERYTSVVRVVIADAALKQNSRLHLGTAQTLEFQPNLIVCFESGNLSSIYKITKF